MREAYWFALAQAAREAVDGSRRAKLGPPDGELADPTLFQQIPPPAIGRVERRQARDLTARDPGWASRIEARGVLVATPPHADLSINSVYRLHDSATTESGDGLRSSPNERWLAMNLRTYEEVGNAVRNGVEYCCGNFVVAARRPEGRQVSALAVNAANILSPIISGRSAREIAEQFKADTALSHLLLRATRSAAFALNRPLDSIQEAVMMLGARELYRWLSVLLMSADSRSTIATALHETALARRRFAELLAQGAGKNAPAEQLFVTETFSLLDHILNVPLEVALALTSLPTAATEALIDESGPWWPYLAITLAIKGTARKARDPLRRVANRPRRCVELGCTAREWAAATVKGLRVDEPARAPARV